MKIYTYPSESAERRCRAIVRRGSDFKQKDMRDVLRLIKDVRENGDRAVLKYTRRFDAPKLTAARMKVTPEEMAAAEKRVDRSFRRALNRAALQIGSFHEGQKRKSWIQTPRPGTMLGQLVNPVDRAGIYVPGGQGGKTPLVSSVLMNAIPARIAGVRRIVMSTPPQKNGTVSPYLLVTARKAGIKDIYKAGSAWAIAAFAYGTETIPRVDVIAGPGNLYVAIAKKIVAGTVGIDMIAGPSEILVIADRHANPDFIAADLLSQAEHDPLASAVLVTDSHEIAAAVDAVVDKQIATLPRKDIAVASLAKFGAILIVGNISAAIGLANRLAPEHLELQIREPLDVIGEIRNAGAVFIGDYTPEPVGDYIAGPNHVLPTGGTARFSSALSVEHFIKKTSLLRYSPSAFDREAKDIIRIAEVEGLTAHARAVIVRRQKR